MAVVWFDEEHTELQSPDRVATTTMVTPLYSVEHAHLATYEDVLLWSWYLCYSDLERNAAVSRGRSLPPPELCRHSAHRWGCQSYERH